jgi:hypothetical protein
VKANPVAAWCTAWAARRIEREWHTGQVSTDDQKKESELTGEALKAARDGVSQHLLERLA